MMTLVANKMFRFCVLAELITASTNGQLVVGIVYRPCKQKTKFNI